MSNEHDDWMKGIGVDIDKFLAPATQAKQDAESSVQAKLLSGQRSVLGAVGASDETMQTIESGQQAIADFEKGRQAGRASGASDLINMLPPVQAIKAGVRLATADDAEAEAQKIMDEKAQASAGIANLVNHPLDSVAGMSERFAKESLKARDEGRTAEFAGNLVGHSQVIGETVGAGGGIAGLAEGGAVVAAEGGAIAAGEGGAIAVGEGGAVAVGEGGAIAVGEGGAVAVGEGGAVAVGEGGAVAVGEGGAVAASEGGAVAAGEGGSIAAGEGGAVGAGEGGGAAAGEGGGAAAGEGGAAGGDPLTIVPEGEPIQPLEGRPTEFPKGPEFDPTVRPPGRPASEFPPGVQTPFEDPLNPRIPGAPRLPTFEPGFEAPDFPPPPDTVPQPSPPEFAPESAPPDTVPQSRPPVSEPAAPLQSPAAESVPEPGAAPLED